MSWSTTRRSRRSRYTTQRSLRPRIDDLESRVLLSTTPLVAHPTFELGPLGVNNGPPSGAYTPAQIQQAYGFNEITFNGVAGNGSGETIAIVDAYNDPNIQADLNTFDTQFGLPATTVAVDNENGGTSYPASDPTGDWELEESLDVEWAHAMAPAASIALVEADSAGDNDLLAAVAYAAAHANVVSMSWGGGEFSGETGDDSDFDQAGVAFVASSGDAGAPISWPAASPNVLSVGGTALTLGAGNHWSSEVGWSGSGGGPSVYESQPSYQNGVVTQTSSARANPDVAYDASPSTGFAVYDSVKYEGTNYGWIQVGGTSAGAPQWSALLAIADQGRAANSQPALDSTSPQEVMNILYKNPADFHDITSGTSTGTPNYSAEPGYDYVTGLGSPVANVVAASLDGTSAASNDKLVLAAPPAETAGTSFSLTVTAQNSSGATDAGYIGTIHFSSSDVQAGLPADFTFRPADQGTYSFNIMLKTAGSQSITATDTATSAVTGTLSGINVSPAAASRFVLTGLSLTPTAGVPQSVTVTAEDPYGNVATGFAGTIGFTSTDPQAGMTTYTFTAADKGAHTFSVTFETAGAQSVTVADTASGITATQAGITVQAAAAKTFTVTGFPVVDTAGAAGTVVVTAYDAYGNVATGYTGTVSLTSSDHHAALPSSFTFAAAAAGQHSFPVALDTAGSQWITATDTATSSLTATESGITVQASAAKTFTLAGFPTTDTAGAVGNVVVTAYDAYGNVATGYTGTVSLTSSDHHAALPSSFTFAAADAGQHSFSVALDTAGPQSITATDATTPSVTGALTGITVQPAVAQTLTVAGVPATVTAGTAYALTVTAHDAYGNVATGYAGTLSLTSSDPHSGLPSSYTFAAADAGQHSVSVAFDTAGDQSIIVTDTVAPSLTATESNITVKAAAAQALRVTGFPAVEMAGVAGNVTVTAYDAYGNVATGYTGTISFSSSDALALRPSRFTFVADDAGTHTFSFTLETAGSQSITATDTAISTIMGTEASITVRATPQVTWSSPASIVYGAPLGAAQLDASANVAGTFTYSPAEGAVLNAGSGQVLSVTFTPHDMPYYTAATAITTIDVSKAAPIVKVTDAGGRFDGSPFPAVATIAGAVAGVDDAPAFDLENVVPTLTYFDGSGTGGTSLGSVPPSAPGTYTVVADFSGNTNYLASLSAPVTFTIGQGAATLDLASSVGSPVYGQSVSLIATVSTVVGSPTGTVTFFDGATRLATVPLDGSGKAMLTTSALSSGSHWISATYSGDADFLGVQSAAKTETVAQAGTEMVVTQNSVFKRKKLTSVYLTAEIRTSAPGGGVPTGEVTFELVTKTKKKVKVTRLGSAAVSDGAATVTLKANAVLKQAITIMYSGDANDWASTLITPKLN